MCTTGKSKIKLKLLRVFKLQKNWLKLRGLIETGFGLHDITRCNVVTFEISELNGEVEENINPKLN